MHYSFKSTPTYTFKGRSQTVTRSNMLSSVPGPSDYQVKKPLHKAATISPTKQQRNLFKTPQAFPAPGAYEAKTYITDGPKRSMSARYIDHTKKTPGPQDYDNDTLKVHNKQPVFTMGNKSKSFHQITFDKNDYKPAPTTYESKTSLGMANSAVIGISKRRDLTQTEKTPAPNYYAAQSAADYASRANPRCRIGEQARKTEFGQGEKTPGPAFYNKRAFVQENKDKKRGYSCRQKTPNLIALELSKFPAPGQYESHLKNKLQAPRCSTGQTKRKTFMDDMQDFKKSYPGPGVHNPDFVGTKYRSVSACNFGKSSRKPLDQNQKTPGPVFYQNDKIGLLRTAPKYSSTKELKKNQFLKLNPENPGPGQYDANFSLVKESSKVNELPKQKRPDFEKHRYTPGPGFYNLRGKEAGPQWTVPGQKRVSFTDRKNEAKDGLMYEIPGMVPNPPKYMNVTSKIQYSPSKQQFRSTGFSNK